MLPERGVSYPYIKSYRILRILIVVVGAVETGIGQVIRRIITSSGMADLKPRNGVVERCELGMASTTT
jgi:hypothetical protein